MMFLWGVMACHGTKAEGDCSITTPSGDGVGECGVWESQTPTYGLGFRLGSGDLGGSDVLLASAPCYIDGDEHVGGICDSALFNLADLPFGLVNPSEAAWVDVEGGGFQTFELYPPGQSSQGTLYMHAGDHVHRFDTVPSAPLVLSRPTQVDPSALFEVDGWWIPTSCIDADEDGQSEVCRWHEDFRILPGPLGEQTEAQTPLFSAVGSQRGPVVFLSVDGGHLVAFGQPVPIEPSTGVKLAGVSEGSVNLAERPNEFSVPNLVGVGSALAAADFDGDGNDELVVASPYAEQERGRVMIVRVWSPSDVEVVASFIGDLPGGLLGLSLAVGDVNGDGRVDLAAGAPLAGAAHVWLGPLDAMTDDQRWTLRGIGEDGDDFGRSLEVTALNGGGLAVGAPSDDRHTVGGGSVYWFGADEFR